VSVPAIGVKKGEITDPEERGRSASKQGTDADAEDGANVDINEVVLAMSRAGTYAALSTTVRHRFVSPGGDDFRG
jgi:hypothetical protein